MCWLWHHWGKWEPVMLRRVVGMGSTRSVVVGPAEDMDVLGQQRTCNRCGKTRIRTVWG
jgi:hypothetical protein